MKILVCPLNWGLGHAARCVPIIRQLISEGNEVVIAADGFPLQFLQLEFPELRLLEAPSQIVRYSKGNSQVGAMIKSIPRFFGNILQDHYWLRRLLKQEQFDRVISDNRFGCWNKRTYSIYITHQLMIKMPPALKFMESVIWRLHRFFIHHYDECWIPDLEGEENFSGDLSHRYPLPHNAHFIGIRSRFQSLQNIIPNFDYETVMVLSGPEPQRSIFEEQLTEKFSKDTAKSLIIQGLPRQKQAITKIGNLTKVSHLSTQEMASFLKGAKKIIARSGYSTIMDLQTLDCLNKAILVPTPGQTEQIYLAELHKKHRNIENL
ncbi:MAG: hypothetical protein KA976_05375 [Paludibacteraceae bacterium]|nr:hypothetical protein [Paludibacteraceae bacterium]